MGRASGVVVGLDVGGTRAKGGWVGLDELERLDPAVLAERTRAIDTDVERGAGDLLDRLAELATELGWDGALGVGCPGVFDASTGVLLRSANLAPLDGVDLAAELGRRLGCPRDAVRVENDANAAAYGEQWLGAGRGVDDLVMLTLGTGIGSGIVLGGELFRGVTGKGAEVGHLVVKSLPEGGEEEPGLRCGCGAYGCLERLASATAAERRAEARGLTGDLRELARRARAAAGPERELMHAVGRDLGAGLLTVTALLDVTCFVIGGGFGRALDVLRPGIEEAYGERDYGNDPLRLLEARLGSSAGWVGAARLALDGVRG